MSKCLRAKFYKSSLSFVGNYTCEIEWIGTPISITHKLTVLVPPSIVAVLPGGLGQVDRPIEAREGSQVRLECRAEGIPPPIVRWRSPVSPWFHYALTNLILGLHDSLADCFATNITCQLSKGKKELLAKVDMDAILFVLSVLYFSICTFCQFWRIWSILSIRFNFGRFGRFCP